MKIVCRIIVVCVVVSLCLVSPPKFRRNVAADEPITTGIVIGVTTAAIVGAGAWLWNKFTKKPKTTVTVTFQKTDPETGNIITVTVSKESNSAVGYKLPDDLPNFQTPQGYTLDEETLLDARQDESVLTSHKIKETSADVLSSPDNYVGYQVRRVTTMQFDRPAGVPLDEPSQLRFDLDIQDLKIGTTDVTGTNGTSYYSIDINSPQLGNLFGTAGVVEQGGSFVPSGDISLADYVVTPGNATLNYKKPLIFTIPSGLSSVEVSYTFVNGGDGVEVPVPLFSSTFGILVAISIAVLALLLTIILFRHRRTTP